VTQPAHLAEIRHTDLVFPHQTNHQGSYFGGAAMAEMDKIAFLIAARHARRPFVTASCDKLDFVAPAHVGDLVELTGQVRMVGRTSMIVDVELAAENLRTGAFLRRDKPEIERDLEQVYDRFPRLRERRVQRAQTMSGGEQQMLAIGRALMSKPRLLLMDEPSMGLAPVIVEEIARIIEEINAQGLSVVLVEQNAELALELAHHAYVLETGNTAMEGPAHELRGNEHVRAAYLGL